MSGIVCVRHHTFVGVAFMLSSMSARLLAGDGLISFGASLLC